jgi:hypothetical protein
MRAVLLSLLLACAALHLAPQGAEAQAPDRAAAEATRPLLAIRHDPASGFRPVLAVGPILREPRLEEAARSGVPVRVRVRVELWRDRFIDQLVDTAGWSSIIVHEPIGQLFFVRGLPPGGGVGRFASFTAARRAIEQEQLLQMRPVRPGRYYYTTTLQIETLSVSDLDELERWLQGELQPAVSGQRSVPGALGQGAKRLMLRFLDLPQRRVDARSERFRFP